MCHVEKCFLRSFQLCCKIIHFVSLGLRCWEATTSLPLLPFAAATGTLKTKFPLVQAGESQDTPLFPTQMLLCNCDRGCCPIVSIFIVSFLRGTAGTWSRRRHSVHFSFLFCSLFLPSWFPVSYLPFRSSWSMGLMFLWHYPQWRQALSWVIISDSMPDRSSLLFLVFVCFSWLPYHLLTQ